MGAQERDEVRDNLDPQSVQIDADAELDQAAPNQLVLSEEVCGFSPIDGAKSGQHVALLEVQMGAQASVELSPEAGGVFASVRVKGGPQLLEEPFESLVIECEPGA